MAIFIDQLLAVNHIVTDGKVGSNREIGDTHMQEGQVIGVDEKGNSFFSGKKNNVSHLRMDNNTAAVSNSFPTFPSSSSSQWSLYEDKLWQRTLASFSLGSALC